MTDDEIAAAREAITSDERNAIDTTIENVREFHTEQRTYIEGFEKEFQPGVTLGQRVVPIDSVGVYVPGGRYPLVAAPAMTIVPATIAGVDRIVACAPPQNDGSRETTAHGLRFSSSGGAQAIFPLLLANVGLSLGVAAFALAPTFAIACVGVALVGVGQGLAFSLLRSVITDRAADGLRGGIVGVGESIIRLSNSLVPLLTGVAIGVLRPEAGSRAALLTTLLGVALVGGLCGVGTIYVGCSRQYAAS